MPITKYTHNTIGKKKNWDKYVFYPSSFSQI